MASYSVSLKRSVLKDLESLPARDRLRIMERIGTLADDPRPRECEKLSALERYRIRVGDYRIVYSIEDDALVVWVVRVGHRRDVYRNPG
jgi:mRNA interferase RelE/StbE